MENKIKIKYLRDENRTPIACLAYCVLGGQVHFGLAIRNPDLHQLEVQKTIKQFIPDVDGNNESGALVDTGKKKTFILKQADRFTKKEGRELALSRLNSNPNKTLSIHLTNPLIDILSALKSTRHAYLGSGELHHLNRRILHVVDLNLDILLKQEFEKDQIATVLRRVVRKSTKIVRKAIRQIKSNSEAARRSLSEFRIFL